MRIKMHRTIGSRVEEAPTVDGEPLQEGKVYDLAPDECEKLVAAKLAEFVDKKPAAAPAQEEKPKQQQGGNGNK